MSFQTMTPVTEDASAAIELRSPEERLQNELTSLEGVTYAAVRRLDDVLMEEAVLVQVRGGDLCEVAEIVRESGLRGIDFHHSS